MSEICQFCAFFCRFFFCVNTINAMLMNMNVCAFNEELGPQWEPIPTPGPTPYRPNLEISVPSLESDSLFFLNHPVVFFICWLPFVLHSLIAPEVKGVYVQTLHIVVNIAFQKDKLNSDRETFSHESRRRDGRLTEESPPPRG